MALLWLHYVWHADAHCFTWNHFTTQALLESVQARILCHYADRESRRQVLGHIKNNTIVRTFRQCSACCMSSHARNPRARRALHAMALMARRARWEAHRILSPAVLLCRPCCCMLA